jgi:hypothetical protein
VASGGVRGTTVYMPFTSQGKDRRSIAERAGEVIASDLVVLHRSQDLMQQLHLCLQLNAVASVGPANDARAGRGTERG